MNLTSGSFGTLTDFGFKMFLLSLVFTLLPTSPFRSFISLLADVPYLSYLNWFIPVSDFAAIFEVWLSVVVIYYGYLFVLRFANGLKGS